MKKPELKKPNLKMPNLKGPEVKVPEQLSALVDDLRERRLLPVVILLAAAIIAVPVLLSSGAEKTPAPSPVPAAVAAGTDVPEAQLAVLSKTEGLRDFKQRLRDLRAKDPFMQQYTTPQKSQAAEQAGALTQTVEEPSAPIASEGGSGTKKSASAKPSKPQTSSQAAKPETQLVSYEIDVWTGESGNLKLREGVSRFTALPYDAKPAAAFIGVTNDGKKALFQISSSVLTLSGDGVCLLGIGRCDTISLSPGKSATMLFGPNGVTYGLKLVRINRVVKDA